MAIHGIVDIYSNDGETVIVTFSTQNNRVCTLSITDSGLSFKSLYNGVEDSTSEEWVYDGTKNFLGLSKTQGSNSVDNGYGIGNTISFDNMESVNFYIVEGEPITPTLTYNLTKLNLAAGTHNITVVAKAEGYLNSAPSNSVEYTVEADSIVGTWLFNEYIEFNGGAWYSVNFTSNGVSYIAFSDRRDQTSAMHDMSLRYFKTPTTYDLAFGGDGSWRNEAYRTITINEEPTDEEFIAWLKANATKQEAEEPQDDSIVGVWAFKQNATPDGLPVQTDAALIYSTATKGSTEFGKLNTFIPSTSQSSTYNIGINLSRSTLPNKYVGVYTYSSNYPYLAFGRANSTQGVSTLAQYIAAIEFYSNIESDDIVIDERFVTWLKANATKQSTFNFISFTIDTTTYQAEEGMTWLEWVGSRYNTKGYTCSGATAYIERGSYLIKQSTNTPPVVGSDYIINEGVYIDYNNSPGGGGGSND